MGRRGGERKPRKARPGHRARQAPAPVAASGPDRQEVLAGAALVLLVAAAYLPAFSAGFVWDDRVFTEARAVREWSGLWTLWFRPSEIGNEAHYWPLVYSSFWLEHKLWGFDPAGYHAVNVLLHGANSLVLWRLARRLELPGAWLLAALFAVHPLHVESVAWTIERKDLLSGLFYLAAFGAWLRFTETPRGGGWHYLLALVLFVLGLLCKSMVVTLPAALAICHWWRHGRIDGATLLRLAPLFAVGLAIASADAAFYAEREPLALGYSPVERVLIAAQALWFYAGKLLWPAGLAVIYPHWPVAAGDPLAWGYVAAALGLGLALWLLRGRIGRGPLAAAAFFAVSLSPVLGFVDYGYMQFSFVADRYQYLAGIGVLAPVAGLAARGADALAARGGGPVEGWRRLGAGRGAALAAIAMALAALAVLTFRQAELYRDGVTFFSHIVAHNPTAREAHRNLGDALVKEGRVEEALEVFHIAARLAPKDARDRSNIGAALILLERGDEAEQHLRHALELDSRSIYALQNLAALESIRENHGEALGFYRRLAEAMPGNPDAWHGIGTALYRLGRPQDALAVLEHALALDPARRDIALNRDQLRCYEG